MTYKYKAVNYTDDEYREAMEGLREHYVNDSMDYNDTINTYDMEEELIEGSTVKEYFITPLCDKILTDMKRSFELDIDYLDPKYDGMAIDEINELEKDILDQIPEYEKDTAIIYILHLPLKDMPLYINSYLTEVVYLAKWRLDKGK